MHRLFNLIEKHYLLVSGLIGGILIILWTLVRFLTERSIFDLVGQQLIARIAFEGGAIDATVGATHYILKLFLLYIPFESLGVEPRLSLIVMTILVNVVAYIGIMFALRSIVKHFKALNQRSFVVGMVWLAAMAGSIFWIQFTNSRNIEVAAGLWTIALALQFLHRPMYTRGFVLLAVATLTFFMDPMQLYVTAIPLVIYAVFVMFLGKSFSKTSLARLGLLTGIFILSAIFSVVTLYFVERATGLTVLDTQSAVDGVRATLGDIMGSIAGIAQSNIRLFGGYLEDGGRLKQLFSVFVIGAAFISWVYYAIRGQLNPKLVAFVVIFFSCVEIVYLASGQALNGDTTRYLIMTAPLAVIVIATLPLSKNTRFLHIGILTVVAWSVVWLGVTSSNADAFSQDARLGAVGQYVKEHGETRFYSSMDIALPAMYYDRGVTILPLSCDNAQLGRTDFFYPKSEFDLYQNKKFSHVAVILNSDGAITNYPNVCDEMAVMHQIGEVVSTELISTGEKVIYFNSARF